jgi:hypothetical protein
MHLIAGTLPDRDLPLIFGEVTFDGETMRIDGRGVLPIQGTGACLLSAVIAHDYLKTGERVNAVLIGDIGDGQGSRQLYTFLENEVPSLKPKLIVFHYILPIMGMMRRVISSCQKVSDIKLIADAGSMYAAKACGFAKEFEVFTPDNSELAFLADEKATHPAYIAHHLFAQEDNIEELINRAYSHDNAARVLMVKGKVDYIVEKGSIIAKITDPDIPSLEAIGGTGDTITGLISTFIYIGMKPWHACWIAGMTNRYAGLIINPTPATKVLDIIKAFPTVGQIFRFPS